MHRDIYSSFFYDIYSIFLGITGNNLFIRSEYFFLEPLSNLKLHGFAPMTQIKNTGFDHIE